MSGKRELVWGHEARVAQHLECHAAAGPDGEPGDAAVAQAHAEPALRGELESPANTEEI